MAFGRLLCVVLPLLLASFAGAAPAREAPELPVLRLDPGGHTARVTQVLFTPDGREILSVGEDKVIRWEERSYGSLSEVARAITGTRWSGPAFFGLKKKAAAA